MRKRVLVAIMMMAGGLLMPSSANANFAAYPANYGTKCDTAHPYRADNNVHTFQYSALSASMQVASDWTRTNAIETDNPNLDTNTDPTPGADTDVVVTDTNYTSLCGLKWFRPDGNGGWIAGLDGLYVCETRTSAGACGHATVRFNNYATNQPEYDALYERRLAAHEIGHSLGLWHRAYNPSVADTLGCMEGNTAARPNARYSSHDQIHLDWY